MTDSILMEESVNIAEKHLRYLHTIPEMAFGEKKTTEYVKKVIGEYPVSMIDLGMETGAVAYLDAGAAETIALRADMDAVPTEHGYLHLCGHDAHTSTLLGAMHCLCGLKKGAGAGAHGEGQSEAAGQPLPYNVLFVFQPAEEGTHGARAMLDHGLLDKAPQRPVRIFGIHNRPEVSAGDVVVHRGPLMSEKSVFSITLTGKAGHGSLPHKCVDPVVAAAALVTGMQTIISRNIDPFEPAICTVNSITAGMSESSAPESAVVTGYIRSFDHGAHQRMAERLTGIAEGTAKAYECRCDIRITHMVPAVNNGDAMYEIAKRAAEAAVGAEHVIDSAPSLASEDFAVYGEEIPSFFYWVGSGTAGRENAPWHDPAFCIDPHYPETAVPLLVASALTV